MPKKGKAGKPEEEWVAVQKRTFTNWINHKLEGSGHQVTNLETDLADGVILIKLLEILSHKKPSGNRSSRVTARYHVKPSRSAQRSANMSAAFEFMRDEEQLSLVNIGPNDILEHKLKKILSLLWQLIMHYQVTEANQGSKIVLLEWMNATLPDKDITNFTTDWNDGINLSALVDYCKPGLIPNHPFLEPSNAIENITKAMALAEEHLGIPQIMQPDDLAAEKPDEQSVMTYLSFFCCPTSPGEVRLLSWIQKQIPSKNVTNFTTDWVSGEALGMLVNEVSANGFPDYDQHQHMTKQNDTENCKKSMDAAKQLLGIKSTLEPEEFANPELNPVSRATYLVQFYFAKLCPKVVDLHIPSKPGSGQMVWLDLLCPEESGETVQGSAQRSAIGRIPVEIENTAPNKYRVKFQAKTADTYTLAVYVNGNCVKGSPFRVDLNPPDPDGVKLTNTILPKKAGLPVSLFFDTIGAGKGEVTAQATGKRVGQVPVHIDQTSSSECKVCFIPFEGDTYTLEVHFDGERVRGSPFVYPLTSIAQPESVKCGKPKFSKPHNPVHLDIDVRDAGTGKLTARCRGELSGEIEVEIMGDEDQPTGIMFTPPEEDVYTLSIRFDDTEVNGSPFSINLHPVPPDAEKVTVIEPPSGRLNAGEEIKICFDTTEAGTGILTASCKGNSVGDIPVTVDKVSEQRYAVLFTPPEEDIYSVNVMWADTQIRGSPFTINLIPKDKPDASKCSVVSPLIMSGLTNKIFSSSNTAIYTVNREVSFEIDTTGAGRGSFSVTATTQEGEAQTPYIEPIPERPEVFKISYTPVTPGTHTLKLLWADEALPSSPMSFEVIDATLLPFGIPVLVNMTANCRKRNLKAYAVYQGKEVQYKLKIDKLDKGRFHLTFKPKDEGIYYIHVLDKDKELPRSPLKVCCTKAIKATNKTDGNVDFVVEEGYDDELDSQLDGMTHASSMSTIGSTIASMSTIGNTVAAISVPISPESITLTHMEKSPSPEEKNTSKATGKGWLQTKWGAKETVTGLNLEDEKFRVGVPHSFKLHCEDLGEGKPDIACKPPAGAEISMSPAPGDNSYWVEILPKKAGKYELTAKFNGNHILGSPFHVQFTTRSDASKCILEDSPPECQKMSTGAQNIIFCVSNKGAGKGKLTATAKSISTKETVPVTITRPFKHHFHVEFDPSEGLNYTLTIKYDDINIPGSPFKLALGDASKCRMEGEGIIEAWLHEKNQFRVNTEEAGPGQLNVSVEGADVIVEPDVFMPAEGTFEVAYHPTRCGLYTVSVKWGNQDIPGSPFDVKCRRRILPSEFHIPDLSAGAYIGKPLKLTLVAEGTEIEQEERFTGFVRSSYDEEFSLQIEKGDSGACICTIDPLPTLGVCGLHILWMGEHITGSPFDLEVVPLPKPDEFIIEAVEADGGAIAVEVHGPMYAFRCGELKASVENAVTMDEVPVTATKLSHQEYNIEFKPGKCGEYLLSITYDDDHIQGSPFRLIATDASLCYTKGKGLTAAQFGEENKFVVCTENAGSGELLVDIEGEGENVEFLISAASENRYEVTYNPLKLGMYRVSVKWGEQHIPGSPFEVLCVNATRYSVVKPPKEISLGKVIKVGVKVADNDAPDWEKLEIVARLKDNRSFKGEVKKGNDGNYICTVTPPELGKYQIHVRCNSLDIPGSPFKIKVLEAPIPENVKAYGEGLENGTIGQERLFNIELKNAGYGYLGFRVQGPKKGFKIRMDRSEEEEDTICARYTPIYTGDYNISVLWSGVHVPGSPFYVNITESEEQASESGFHRLQTAVKVIYNVFTSDMPMTEMNGKQWVAVQKRTFTNWMNHKLEGSGYQVTNLETDLADGVILIKLLEILSHKKPSGKLHVKPSHSAQWIVNTNTAFAFMRDVEQLSLVNIDPNDILEHNLKQILTLLWQLIMHYQVTEGSQMLLLEWMNATLPDNDITNFTTDWNDGINLSALVNYCKPGLIPNHPFLEPSNAIENITKAMALAEEHLGIPQIMQPDDLAAEKPDEQSVMTYLSLFCDPTSEMRQLNLVCPQKSGKIVQGYEKESTPDDIETLGQNFTLPAEDRYKLSISSDDTEVSGSSFFNLDKPDASKCSVVSQLIMSGLTNKIFSSSNTAIYTVNREVSFEIDTTGAGRGSLSVTASTQEGEAQTPYIEPIPERPEVFKISYTPATPGTHTLKLLWADEALPSSPMSFEVMDATLLPFGIPILVNMTANCRKRNMKAYAVYQGKEVQYKMKIDKLDKGRFHLTFKPKDEGIYYIHVLNEDKELPRSPLTVCCTKEVKAGSSADSHIDFVVDSLEAELENQLDGMTHSSSVSTIGSTNMPECAPSSPESITLTSSQENKSVPSERHTFSKMARKELSPLRNKWGALKGGVTGLNLEDEKFRVGVPHLFKLHCEDLGEGTPDIACKPPAGAKISMSPAPGDNSYWVEILPKKAGKYELTAEFNGKHILGSPFHVQFTTRSDASKCILEDSPPECQKMSTGTQNIIFCVSNKGAGKGKLTAMAKSIATKETVPITITRHFKHHYHIEFNPSEGLNYTLTIKYDDINIPGSPFKLALGDASKCRMEGEGIIEAWLHENNRFRVNTEEAGAGQLNVSVEGDDENVEPAIFMPAEGIVKVAYQPTRCGLYSISVRWGKQDIPGSPFEVNCCRRVPQRSNYFAITWLPAQKEQLF